MRRPLALTERLAVPIMVLNTHYRSFICPGPALQQAVSDSRGGQETPCRPTCGIRHRHRGCVHFQRIVLRRAASAAPVSSHVGHLPIRNESQQRETIGMKSHQSNGSRSDIAQAAMSTSARVAWIDRCRFKLGSLVPDLAPIDAAALALAAFDDMG